MRMAFGGLWKLPGLRRAGIRPDTQGAANRGAVTKGSGISRVVAVKQANTCTADGAADGASAGDKKNKGS